MKITSAQKNYIDVLVSKIRQNNPEFAYPVLRAMDSKEASQLIGKLIELSKQPITSTREIVAQLDEVDFPSADTIEPVQPTPTPEPTINPEQPIIIRYTNDINGDYDRNQSTYSGEQHATKREALYAICGNGIQDDDHVRLALNIIDGDLDLTDLDEYDQQYVQQILNLPIETKTGWVIIDDRYTNAVAANKFNSLNDLLTYTKAQTLPEALDNLRNKCNWSDNDRYEYALDLRRDDITLIAKGYLDNGIGWVLSQH